MQAIGTFIAPPDDHFTAGPHCRVKDAASWCVSRGGGRPTIRARIVFPARVRVAAIISTPDDHFTAGPHCRVTTSGSGRVAGAYPTIRAKAVSSAGAAIPHDHFTAGPDGGVICSRGWRVGGAGGCPSVRAGIVPAPGIEQWAINPSPDDHFAATPDCRVKRSGSGRVGGGCGFPTICAGV